MQRTCRIVLLAAILLGSCSKQEVVLPPAPEERKPAPVVPVGRVVAEEPPAPVPAEAVLPSLPEPSKQDRYEAALLEALDALADRKCPEALAALEKAQRINDTGQVQREFDKVRTLMAQRAAAEKATADVRTILEDGKPGEAASLAHTALSQYGAGQEAAEALTRLKRQADAVVTAEASDLAARRARLRGEAEAALKEENLRGAVVALEQVLALGEDVELRNQCDKARARLALYDDNCKRAAVLRKDPSSLEEAVGCLEAAAKSWNTMEVRLLIDEYKLAMQLRRERISVADLEVRGDVGVPAAGRSVAEELLPHFKPRFDLVEREQLSKVLSELNLGAADLTDNVTGRGEVARLAGVRYLVVGSLTTLNGVTLNARLVDVRTGLIAQTARLSAPTVEALLPKLRQVALMLMMTDEQKLAYEAKLAAVVVVIKPIEVLAEVPPPPAPTTAPPPPILTYAPQPPVAGRLVIEDFNRLPPVLLVPAPPPPPLEVVLQREDPRRGRLIALSLQLGDNLFRRGRHREAQRHFQLALSLSGHQASIQVRIDNCRPFLPPPPPAVVVSAPVVVAAAPAVRPRLAVFGFVVGQAPGLVPPPGMGDWAADTFASYFGRNYELIDRGEVCWYMGRLGITMREVLNDPAARRCLAQALNARYFVLGSIQPTASFNVSTHLLDAESGARTGTGTIHVQDQDELKLRMHELAKQLGAPVKEQVALAQQGAQTEKALNEARKLQKAGDQAKAAEVAAAALKATPNNVALQAIQQDAARKAQQAQIEAERRRDAAARSAAVVAAQKRQKELAAQAAEARTRAEREAKSRTEAQRKEQELAKQRAAEQLRAQARTALAKGNPTLAVQSLQSAVALKADDAAFRELAQARAEVEKANRARADAEKKKRDDDVRKEREAAAARVKVEQERKAKADAEKRLAQEKRDQAAHDAYVKQARDLMAKKQYDQALGVAQSARRLKASPESAELVRQAQEGQALIVAEKKGAAARAEAERKLAEERKKRDAVETANKRAQEAYLAELKNAQKAIGEKRYDQAVVHYQSAIKMFRTDAALTGLKQAEDLRNRDKAAREAEKRRADDEAKRVARVKAFVVEGQKQLLAKQFDRALSAYGEAKKLAPTDVEVLTGLSRAERERAAWAAEQARRQEEAKRNADYVRLMAQGQSALTGKRFAEAITAYGSALKTRPGDPAATQALRVAQEAAKPKAPPPPPPPNPKVEHARLMQVGAGWEKQGKYAEALSSYQAALKQIPNEPAALAAARNAQFLVYWTSGRAHHLARRYTEAAKAYEEALKLQPMNATVKDALARAKAGKP